MNQLQTCTDNLLKMLLDELQMRISDEYYEEVSTTKSDLDKKALTLNEACHRIRFMYETYTESNFSDWIFELDRFTDTMERIIGEPIAIPAKLQAFMQGEKQSVPLPKDFADFKHYLLTR